VALILLYMFVARTPDRMEDRVQIATAVFAGVAPVVALVQARKASQQTEQALTTDISFRLYEMYTSEHMHQAIADVWHAVKQDGKGVNQVWEFVGMPDRYQFLKKYIAQMEKDKVEDLDKSRRRVTHFWYLIANLLNKGMLRERDVFEWFGPPDVIWVLEGLEVIKQNLDTGGVRQTSWPPLQILKRYYKSKGIGTTIPIVHIDQETIRQIRTLAETSA